MAHRSKRLLTRLQRADDFLRQGLEGSANGFAKRLVIVKVGIGEQRDFENGIRRHGVRISPFQALQLFPKVNLHVFRLSQ